MSDEAGDAGASASGGSRDSAGSSGTPGASKTPSASGKQDAGQPADGKDIASGIKGNARDAFDPDARVVYEAGRRVLNPGGTTVFSGQSANVTVQNFLGAVGSRAPAPPGQVPGEELDHLRDRYVEPAEYEDLEAFLRSRRLLVLVGPPDTGRSTTALYLLDQITDARVFRLDRGQSLTTLSPEQVKQGHGYVGSLEAGDVGSMQSLADRLRQLVPQQGVYCVLVATDDPVVRSAFGATVQTFRRPEPLKILRRHVDAGARDDDRAAVVARAIDVVEREGLAAVWRSGWRPADVVGLAELLLALEYDECTLDAVRAYPSGLLEERIAGWMSALRGTTHGEKAERARRLTAFRISCAVFDGMPRHIIEQSADDLALCMAQPPMRSGERRRQGDMQIPRLTTRNLAIEDDGVVLDASGLRRVQSKVRFLGVEVPADLLRFRDDRLPAALLKFVWLRHPPLRQPMVAWLDGLSRDSRPAVRTRAAQAAGLLCAVDFGGTVDALVTPAAKAAPRRRRPAADHPVDGPEQVDELEDTEEPWEWRRHFAAVALDHAARDADLRPAVHTLLKRWSRNDDSALRWTAARALGYDIGLHDVAAALDELRIIGTPQERTDLRKLTSRTAIEQELDLIWVAGLSLAYLFVNGPSQQVLSTLEGWNQNARLSLRDLAAQAVILVADVKVAAIGRPDAGTPDFGTQEMLMFGDGSRSRWPVLLALESIASGLVDSAAVLLRSALRGRAGEAAAEVVTRWLDQAQADAAALDAVERFLPRLITEQSDQAMLRSLIGRKRRAWADPLRPDVADRLIAVIDSTPVVARRKEFG